MPSNNAVILLWIKEPRQAVKALATNYTRVEIKLCYCSIYEECWITSNMLVKHEVRHEKVEVCPETKVQFVNDMY